ncbi:hypothetical protein V1509DRAFT_351746 [Lipomyces kononenkoae]
MRRRQPPLVTAVRLADYRLTTRTVQFLAIGLAVFVAIPLAIYTFYYPIFRSDLCNWPSATYNPRDLRLLLFGDPQIRGASTSTSLRTRLDIFGNDHYLGHIYSTLVTRLDPTHIIVAGDLFSSQWISDDEFDVRARRYKNRIFRQPRAPQVTPAPVLLNLSGNHDIGYAHDVTRTRVRRFEKHFGQLNFIVTGDDFRIVVFNSMSLDGSLDDNEHGQAGFTRDVRTFLEEHMKVNFEGTTILATHVPLHKPVGVCIDKPYFSYYGDKSGRLIREQNMLSEGTSQWILNGFFGETGAGRGVIINGHDHEGCLVRHTKMQGEPRWSVVPIASGGTKYEYYYNNTNSDSNDGVLQVTLRSMQGEYGGNAGLLKAAWNATTQDYMFSFSICPFGVQHIWWATYVVAIVAVCANVIAFIGLPWLDEKARRAISGQQSSVNFFVAGAKPQKFD